ncbi:MAG: HypC/HybG/HupF family hydrogenase formation chaperone [Euzebya sp.]
MCLGIPGQVVNVDTDHPDIASVEIQGVARSINVGLLDTRPQAGDWIMVHMGFALEPMTAKEASDAMEFMAADQQLVDQILDPGRQARYG